MRTSYGAISATLLCAFLGLDRASAAQMSSSPGNEMVMPPTVPPKDRLFDLFAHACVDGSVMLKPEEAQPMSLPKVPHVLHQWYSDTANLRVYKSIADRASYLILFDGKPGKYNYNAGVHWRHRHMISESFGCMPSKGRIGVEEIRGG
ncbi:hypothetical protein [Sphingomonas oryzagri]